MPNCGPVGCLGKMLLASSIWGSTKRFLTWQKRDTLFSHSYFRLAASARGMSASELLSSRLMFPTPLASDKSTCRDAANLDVYLSDNGIFRKRNRDGTIWSLSLSAAVFYLTPAASEGYRSTLKPTAFRRKSPSSNLSAQVIHQEQPLSEKGGAEPGLGGMAHGLPERMDGRILWAGEPEGVPRVTEDTKDRALRLKTLGNDGLPAPGLSHFSLHFADRDRGVRWHLPLWRRVTDKCRNGKPLRRRPRRWTRDGAISGEPGDRRGHPCFGPSPGAGLFLC